MQVFVNGLIEPIKMNAKETALVTHCDGRDPNSILYINMLKTVLMLEKSIATRIRELPPLEITLFMPEAD